MQMRILFLIQRMIPSFVLTTALFGCGVPEINETNHWQSQCENCHGLIGEGTDSNYALDIVSIERQYPTTTELALFIEQNMPPNNPDACIATCATDTAAHLVGQYGDLADIEPPSCSAGGQGLNTCGPDGSESCCTSLPVIGGTFNRTYTNNGSGAYNQRDQATISDFELDKYEMTVGRFRQYVNYLIDGGSPPEAGSGKHSHLNNGRGLEVAGRPGTYETGWNSSWDRYIPNGPNAGSAWAANLSCSPYDTWTSAPGNREMMPLTCMNWYEAHAFCIWDGGFLPSEAEWRYAAAGGNEQRRYPWGSNDPGTTSQYAIYECYYPDGIKGNCTNIDTNVADVGITPLGIGRWGHYDLSGSVWEWNLDQYGNFTSPCTDCVNLNTGSNDRILPGGGFHTWLSPYLLSYNRSAVNYATTYRGDYGVGVRCARHPK